MIDPKTHASEHFTWAELDPDGDASPAIREKLKALAVDVLEPIRKQFGKSVHVTSGYRSTVKQKALYDEAVAKYGSKKAGDHVAPPGNSQHELGTAADIYIEGVTPSAIAAFAVRLAAVGGVGIYPSWVHVDIRPRVGRAIARW